MKFINDEKPSKNTNTGPCVTKIHSAFHILPQDCVLIEENTKWKLTAVKKKKKSSIWFFPLRYLLHHMSKQSNYMTKYSNITWCLNSVHTLVICTTSEMFWSYPFPHVFAIPTDSWELLFTRNTSDYYHHIPGSEKTLSGFSLNLFAYA